MKIENTLSTEYESLFFNNHNPILLIEGASGKILNANPAACSFYGYDKEEFIKKNILDINTISKEAFYQEMKNALSVKTKAHYFQHRIANGEARDVEVYSIALDTQNLVYAVIHDITERKKTEDEIKFAYAEVNQIFNSVADGMRVIDLDFNIIRINNVLLDLIGITKEEAIGKKCYEVFPGSNCNTNQCPLVRIKSGEQRIECEIEKNVLNRENVPFMLTVTPYKKPNEELIGIVEVFKDITERKNYEETIKSLAFYDSLTGLPNRIYFNEQLDKAIKTGETEGKMIAIMFLDLDGFKYINDTFGHSAGDIMLQKVSQRLKAVSRNSFLSRISGDEFTLLLSDVNEVKEIDKIAGLILDSFQMPFSLEDNVKLYLTASIGISIYPTGGKDAETLVKNADIAMYYAKRQGKNSYQYYSRAIHKDFFERFKLETHLRQATELNEFTLYYQPQFSIKTGELIGVEALLRWDHSEKGFIPPAEFIPLAEEIGAIVPIGKWVIYEACQQNKKWQEQGHSPFPISINLSARQFQKSNLVTCIQETLKATGLDPKYLQLEITESIGLENLDYYVEILNQLRELGIRIALDDFGTGYSSLSYLKKLPIDTLKIDKSFVRDLSVDDKNKAIAKGVIDLAHGLHIDVIAEGVETEEQLLFLSENECDHIQGYLYGKPMPVKELEDTILVMQLQC